MILMPKDLFIEDNTSVLIMKDGRLQLNKDYDKQCQYYAKKYDELALTKALVDKEDEII